MKKKRPKRVAPPKDLRREYSLFYGIPREWIRVNYRGAKSFA